MKTAASVFTRVAPQASIGQIHNELTANFRADLERHTYATNHVPMTLTALCLFEHATQDGEVYQPAARAHAYYGSTVVPRLRAAPIPGFAGTDHIDTEPDLGSADALWQCLGQRSKITLIGRYLQKDFEVTVVDGTTTNSRKEARAQWLAGYLSQPTLRRCLGAAAYHGTIRIAFALDVDSDADVVMGLATVMASADPVPLPQAHRASVSSEDATRTATGPLVISSVQDSLAALDRHRDALARIDPYDREVQGTVRGIDGSCKCFYADATFQKMLPWLALEDRAESLDRTLRDIAGAAAANFRRYHDFTALHGVTSAASLIRLMAELRPFLPVEILSEMLSGFWATTLAVVAMMPAKEADRQHEQQQQKPSNVATLEADHQQQQQHGGIDGLHTAAMSAIRAADRDGANMLDTGFEHLVKLVYACVYAARVANDDWVPAGVASREWADAFIGDCIFFIEREAVARAPF